MGRIIKLLLQFGLPMWVALFIANFLIYEALRYFIKAQTGCMTVQQVQSDPRCLYILNGQIYEKDSRQSPHRGHACGTDVTAILPVSHLADVAKYIDPSLRAPVCTGTQQPTPTPTRAPTPTPTRAPTNAPTSAPNPAPTSPPNINPTSPKLPTPTTKPGSTPTPISQGGPTLPASASPTPISGLVATPSPTPSFTLAPTLAPTGPAITSIAVGLIGIVLTIAGLILLISF